MPTFSGPTNIPPWEAFKIGVPVLYSDIHNIKQVYKDAVYYIDPLDPEATFCFLLASSILVCCSICKCIFS